MSITITTTGGLARDGLCLELYHDTAALGLLHITALGENTFEFMGEYAAAWVEVYLWTYWLEILENGNN